MERRPFEPRRFRRQSKVRYRSRSLGMSDAERLKQKIRRNMVRKLEAERDREKAKERRKSQKQRIRRVSDELIRMRDELDQSREEYEQLMSLKEEVERKRRAVERKSFFLQKTLSRTAILLSPRFMKTLETRSDTMDVQSDLSVGTTRNFTEDCRICMDGVADTAFAPCGHLMTCYHCAEAVLEGTNHCPICRDKVRSILRVYPS